MNMYMLYCAVLSILVMSNSFNPLDYSPSYSSVYGLFQARILELVAISSSRGCSQLRDQTYVSYISQKIPYYCITWEACKVS